MSFYEDVERDARNQNRQIHGIWRLGRAIVAGCWCSFMAATTGCGFTTLGGTRPIDSLFLSYRDHVWANRAYNLTYRGQSRPLMSHHRKGFIAGYCDVCQGGDGYVPALPPEEYWSYEYQSAQGSECVKAWFEGYPEGVAAARRLGADRYRDVFVSDEVKAAIALEKNQRFLPSDVSVERPQLTESDRTVPTATPAGTSSKTSGLTNDHSSLPRVHLPWMNASSKTDE